MIRRIQVWPLLLLALLVGCTTDGLERGGTANGKQGLSTSPSAAELRATPTPLPGQGSSSGVTGGVSSEGATPGAEATTVPVYLPPSPTPTPQVGVRRVTVSPTSLVLYPAPRDASASLGLPGQGQVMGSAEREDGLPAAIRWVDRSGGLLAVSAVGLVSVLASASPGLYYVRAEAVDDPAVYRDVPVEVRGTGELETIVR